MEAELISCLPKVNDSEAALLTVYVSSIPQTSTFRKLFDFSGFWDWNTEKPNVLSN